MKLSALPGLLTASVVSLASAVVIHPEFEKRADLPSPECVQYIKYIGVYHFAYDASCGQLVNPLSIPEFARHMLSRSS